MNPPSRRAVALQWLRRTHGWIGLWGAALGLFMGVTGFLLNHRSVLKIPVQDMAKSTVVLPLLVAVDSPDALDVWLRGELDLAAAPPTKSSLQGAQPVAWGDLSLRQPARWELTLQAPRTAYVAEHWVGSGVVKLTRSDANLWAALTRLHRGYGQGAAWVLVLDTIAGSFVLLAISGLLMWSRLEPTRLAVAGSTVVGFASLAASFVLGWI
jgi:hypothetical protein